MSAEIDEVSKTLGILVEGQRQAETRGRDTSSRLTAIEEHLAKLTIDGGIFTVAIQNVRNDIAAHVSVDEDFHTTVSAQIGEIFTIKHKVLGGMAIIGAIMLLFSRDIYITIAKIIGFNYTP